jgi:uncharacterized membrane protein YraQ (UPF0718 family)
MSDRSQDMNKFLVIEYITDIIAAFLIAILMLQLKTGGIVNRAVIVLIMGLAGGVATHIPEWNWWGFSTIYTVVEFFDHVMGWFFAGLALSALMEKWVPAANRA